MLWVRIPPSALSPFTAREGRFSLTLLSPESSAGSPFAYDVRMKIVSFVLGAVVLAPLGWTIGGLVGETVVASILGGLFGLLMAWVLRRPLSWLFDLLSFLP